MLERTNPNDPKSTDYVEPPAGAIVIGNGIATNTLSVTLHMNGTGWTQMRFGSTIPERNLMDFEPYATTKAWSLLPGGEGTRTVYGELINDLGDVRKITATIEYDTTAPSTGTIEVNGGDPYTNDVNVTLNPSVSDDVAMGEMCFSNDGTSYTTWEPYAATKDWVLTAIEGGKTIYGKFRDAAGNEMISYLTGGIFLDQTPPTGTVVTYNAIGRTNSTSIAAVILHMNVPEAVQMRFSNTSASGPWSSWETYAATKDWDLTSGLGTRTVYAEFLDAADNMYDTSDDIIVETTPPTGTFTINSGNPATTTSRNVTLYNSISDVVEMSYSNDGISYSSWEAYSATKSWTLPINDGPVTVYGRFRDESGNIYQPIDTITAEIPPVVAIGNLRTGGITRSGFVIGTTTDYSPVTVEVKLDGGSYAAATGGAIWKYMLPTGTNTWKENSQHTITVRATDSRSNVSTEVAVTIRKGTNQDVNGDGYADVLVGAHNYSSERGRVYIFHSAGSNGVASRDLDSGGTASTTITGETGASLFGISSTLADVNGDGYADAIVGANEYDEGTNTNEGRAYVFNSSGSSGVTITSAASASTIITGTAGSGLGSGVAAGDINGDGYADVVVGATLNFTDNGKIFIFHSSSSGISNKDLGGGDTATTEITGESSSLLGWFLSVGDINGDGYADLVAGGWMYSSEKGRAYIFHSSSSGISITSAASATTVITGGATGDGFGTSVAVGDVNGDGYKDVIVGAAYYSSNRGRAYIFHSSGSSGVSITAADSATTRITGDASSQFGASCASGDVNGDGYSDAIIGAISGHVYAFHSGSSGISATAYSSFNSRVSYSTGDIDFARKLATSDPNGDGYSDIIIGAPFSYAIGKSNQGRVYICHGGTSGIRNSSYTSGDFNSSASSTIIVGAEDTILGYSVACLEKPGGNLVYAYASAFCVLPWRRRYSGLII